MKRTISCRLCLYPVSKPTTSLKDDITIHGSNICISTALAKIFPDLTKLQIQESDDACFPESICNICLHYLDTSYRFWKQCKKTNSVILNILEEHKSLENTPLIDTNHSQYNLEHCEYYKAINVEKTGVGDDLKEFNTDLDTVNEIIIGENIEDIDEYNSEEKENIAESPETFFEYLRLNNSIDLKGLSWEEYFKTNSSILQNCDIINYKLEHDYCKEFSKYHCPLCQKFFAAESALQTHFEMYHYNVQRCCTKCDQKCLSHFDLLNHTRSNHPHFQCKICKKNYLSVSKFEIHVKRNHNGYEPFECKLCSKTYGTKAFLVKHEKLEHSIHPSGKHLLCRYCNRTFAGKGGLEWHIEVKHGSKIAHKCDICLAEFSNSGSLMKHIKRHKGFKPVICIICNKACPSVIHLQEHIKFKHQTQNTYVCELCDVTCLNQADLINHIQTHFN